MTPEDLRRLADEAQPEFSSLSGPAITGPFTSEPVRRLIAHAPDLARLCAEMGEALHELSKGMDAAFSSRPRVEAAEVRAARAALAKLADLVEVRG